MDIVGYLNSQAPVSNWANDKKQAMLDDFCEELGYQENEEQTKKEFMNEKLIEHIKRMVNGKRRERAKSLVEFDELVI